MPDARSIRSLLHWTATTAAIRFQSDRLRQEFQFAWTKNFAQHFRRRREP